MYVATTNSGTTYVWDTGRLYRLPTPNDPAPGGLIMRNVAFPLGWYDNRPRLSDRPSPGHRWEILGTDPVSEEPIAMTTSRVYTATNTDDWCRHVDEEPRAFCWGHLVWEVLLPGLGDRFSSPTAYLRATDHVVPGTSSCDICRCCDACDS